MASFNVYEDFNAERLTEMLASNLRVDVSQLQEIINISYNSAHLTAETASPTIQLVEQVLASIRTPMFLANANAPPSAFALLEHCFMPMQVHHPVPLLLHHPMPLLVHLPQPHLVCHLQPLFNRHPQPQLVCHHLPLLERCSMPLLVHHPMPLLVHHPMPLLVHHSMPLLVHHPGDVFNQKQPPTVGILPPELSANSGEWPEFLPAQSISSPDDLFLNSNDTGHNSNQNQIKFFIAISHD